jgi:hypothetical protein
MGLWVYADRIRRSLGPIDELHDEHEIAHSNCCFQSSFIANPFFGEVCQGVHRYASIHLATIVYLIEIIMNPSIEINPLKSD